ncbi:MAG: hypothetical protein AABW65_02570 [Nanoarchaeota archaeon]
MEIYFKNKKIFLEAEKVFGVKRFFGLMFSGKNTKNLLFEFRKDSNASLTSLFVFFPFLVLWLDKRNKVIDFKIVKPFRLSIKTEKNYRKFVEIPVNNRNFEIIGLFVGKRKI